MELEKSTGYSAAQTRGASGAEPISITPPSSFWALPLFLLVLFVWGFKNFINLSSFKFYKFKILF